jgi:tripartite-type tricarboxylate transporter receptor subunit TctC
MNTGRPLVRTVAVAGCALLVATGVSAQSYPERPVRMVVDRPAGNTHDLLARIIADRLSTTLKQTFVVDNRVGANGNLAAELVARSTADGYTLLVALDTTVTVNTTLYKHLTFNPQSDLRPLSIMARSSQMLVAHPSVPVETVTEFVAYARKNPVTYAHGGIGSPGHLSMEYFRMRADFPATPVPYRGNTQLASDLAAGQIKFGFVGTSGVIQHVRDGRLKGLAISTDERVPAIPNVPTMAEAGYPDFKVGAYFVILAPAATPEPVAALLEHEIRNTLSTTEVRNRFRPQNVAIVASSASEAAAVIAADTKRWAKVIELTGMRAD